MALGVLVSISSVGAGAVGVTALLLLYPRLPMASIVGSDIAHAVPLTLVAGIGHWALRFGRLAADGRAADRLAARHHYRQLLRGSRAGDGAQAATGHRSDSVAGKLAFNELHLSTESRRGDCQKRHPRSPPWLRAPGVTRNSYSAVQPPSIEDSRR